MTAPSTLRRWLELREAPGLGDIGVRRLVQAFGSPEAVFRASPAELISTGGLSPQAADALRLAPDPATTRRIDEELRAIDRLKIRVLACTDSAYPPRLLTIPDPPPLLYVTGALASADHLAVAIVGSRRATPAGRAITEQLARDLGRAGVTVVSGMARGVDAAAHRGALDGGGRTLAVLGCGIDLTYPPEHKKLREAVEANGAVLSECPVGAPPHSHHFPKRNRIISGLSLGVVVTEAAAESGSLITARLAAEQGREVFAVPGPVASDQSRGPHGLIRQGATLVERAEDVLDELLPQMDEALRARLKNCATPPIPSHREPGTRETMICGHLSFEPIHIDDVIQRTGLTASEVQAALLTLEIDGRVKQLPGHRYIRGR